MGLFGTLDYDEMVKREPMFEGTPWIVRWYEGTYRNSDHRVPEMIAWCKKEWGPLNIPGIRKGHWFRDGEGHWAFSTRSRLLAFQQAWPVPGDVTWSPN